eukprot:sb/3474584/
MLIVLMLLFLQLVLSNRYCVNIIQPVLTVNTIQPLLTVNIIPDVLTLSTLTFNIVQNVRSHNPLHPMINCCINRFNNEGYSQKSSTSDNSSPSRSHHPPHCPTQPQLTVGSLSLSTVWDGLVHICKCADWSRGCT